MGCIDLVRCVLVYVVVWLGWCGIRMQAEALVPLYHACTRAAGGSGGWVDEHDDATFVFRSFVNAPDKM